MQKFPYGTTSLCTLNIIVRGDINCTCFDVFVAKIRTLKRLVAILSSFSNSISEVIRIFSSVSRMFIILIYALPPRFFASAFTIYMPSPRCKRGNPPLIFRFLNLILSTLDIQPGIKIALSCTWNCYALSFHESLHIIPDI